MKFFFYTYIILIFVLCLYKDYGKLSYQSTFPSTLKENSGISISSLKNHVYAINDSGGGNQIFTVNVETGKITQVITIANATNIDWEDLTSNGKDLFIGDFGNNENDRKDQTIYWAENIADNTDSSYTITAKSTTFTLEDQKHYPSKKNNRNFDIEAFIVQGSYFYLFTRNRNRKKYFDGTTKLYRVPKKEGAQIAVLVDSFISCSDRDDCQITGAAIDRESNKIALLSYNKVWIFEDYKEGRFFTGDIKKIKLKHHSQKEAITFKDESTLYIGEERAKKSNGNLYELKLN